MPDTVDSVIGSVAQIANSAHDKIEGVTSEVTKLTAMAKLHHTLILVLLCVGLTAIGLGFYVSHSFNAAIAKADASLVKANLRDSQYAEERKVVMAQMAATAQQIAAISANQQQRSQVIVMRDAQAASAVAKVSAPSQTDQQIADAMISYGAVTDGIAVPANGQIAITPKAGQNITLTKIAADRCTADLGDTQAQLQDETIKFDLSQADNSKLTKLNTSCEEDKVGYKKAAEDYKKAATKSKWRKFLDGSEKVGLFIGGVILGSKL